VTGLRFCFLTTFYPPYNFGGDGIGIQRLARGLAHTGHQVTVLHDLDAYAALAPGPAHAGEPEPPGIDVVPLKSRLGALSPLLTQQLGRPVANGRRIAAILARGNFDVINFHNVSLIGGPGLLRYGSGIKLYMAHEHWLVCPTHVLWRHGRELCTGRQCLRCQLHYRRPPQWWRWTGLLERALAHVDTFIAMSEFSRDKHREFGFPRDMEVLPYFLPETAEGSAVPDAGRPQERPYFLFVGRLERIKGLQDVIPVFAGDGETDLLIAGDGEFGAELRSRATGMSRVRFLGRLAGEELARLYRHAVALIVPSLCYETFGIILLEAFRQSTPVIARRLGPLPEITSAAHGGELFSTLEELRSAMARLSGDPAYRDALGRAARRAFEERWCESVVVPKYLEIVRHAAERKHNSRVLERLLPRQGA
jgi:glycosyltransferase involved in cell wall biosynthesis